MKITKIKIRKIPKIKILYSSQDFSLFERLEQSNKDEMLSWKLPNLYYPIVVILSSIVCFLLFKDQKQVQFFAVINLILNGSIPMMALNRLSSLGVNILKFDKSKEKQKSNLNTYNLRLKLHYYAQGLTFVIAGFYIFQVIHTPFSLSLWLILQIGLSIFCVHQSLKISKYSYLLQERLIDVTFEQEIRDDLKEKGHGQNWKK